MFLDRIKKKTRIKVIIKNNKILKGIILGYDEFMNLILEDCEEYKCKNAKGFWEYRKIGFCFLRGDDIVYITRDII